MKKFMHTHKVYLTPLSPIHIGCGEDFEPTNYVIDGTTLFNFEPSQLALNERERTDLLNAVNRLDLLAIQRFFLNQKDKAIASAYYFADVAEGLAQDYKNRVGKVAQRENDGNKVINNLSIERTAYLPIQHLPYIPGSGFKGAVATALLDQAHQNKNNPKVGVKDHGKLLKEYIGEFEKSKLRYVKFSDFTPLHHAETKIYYALNFKKRVSKTGGSKQEIVLRRECITAGQYRTFKSDLTLMEDSFYSISDLQKSLNAFYLPVFRKEMELLQSRNLASTQYLKSIEKLCSLPNVVLIRLGKNGADSKTYQGENIAQIKIMGVTGFKDSSTTIWLAGANQAQQSDLLPLGWALLEFNPTSDNEMLKTWCEAQPKSKFDRSEILVKREAQKIEQARLQAEVEAKRLAEQKAAEEKQALLNSLSDNQRLVIDFVEKVQNTRERQADNTGSILLKEAQALIESAVENWDISERQFIKSQITVELLKSKVDFKKKDTEKNVKKWFNKLVTE
ncbi:CRISPR-associated protein [Haemophilus influenzae]|uniref:RAMP superfamily CRISPR-associated protein n=1 Tax=Haemophilus influenzae TaxID=727 RepID=UPI0005AF182A|nr:RAMP superfamily CRISPR-associated protein [Haemophilus influenzae]KIP50273.1 CRISPR-associated protein [Haemophilus influenzae]MCK9096599.1 RAMP superfamily CRISPR-associated protein [Haemophilus influenzae]OBX54609.1 CRISPR-associated protein [Haemophilus influenzae]POR97044.1 CRISPR-associated protein [Haemophilus influenzae]VEB28319.1 CRISPR type III-A/MTUBE-associated RAMP protein Csm5 [Haemophilus influenzae]